ncbi:iron chelate uptake ABC transporter family permease subunit [Kribbella sandramycini]|uniref:Iron chelate uptake ABC transporter family permease subunit n=1 Tax=Kribbella sandramycini TaxID=60450 RepID=A0A7Y4NXR3_9ACTN|nr:iron complex transport system permease protein [Kribbella sandramycini]NOL39741.1 iron chelate uptake ABC transporter family permease subunit [Kribbella sandramycini]
MTAPRVVQSGPAIARLAYGDWSVLWRPRAVIASGLVVLAMLAFALVQLCSGDYPMTPGEVLATLSGRGAATQEFVIYNLRLPRLLTAAFVGLALGASGAIFQSVTRNPLGSPEIMGFTMGASAGAVATVLVLGGQELAGMGGALVGGFVTAAVVYRLACRGGGVQGFRLILVGVAATALLDSLVSYLLLRARLQDAEGAYTWLVGSLNGADWQQVQIIGLTIAVLIVPVLAIGNQMRLLEMGDDLAQGLGIRVKVTRRRLLVIGTVLCAAAVATAGPIAFVALAAPQIMRRLTGGSVSIVPAALMGALILIVGDLAAQRIWPDTQMPVGIPTLCIGGTYLAWLLYQQSRASRL